MPLTPPRLDDRDFQSLFEEARSRIPLYLPEWTDWNESDPGITLLQLQAWLVETVLYRLNQLPDLTYIKFLQLLGQERRPAVPAQAMLTFTLKERFDAPETLIARGTVVGVSARDLPEPVFFETERTVTAISARLTLVVQVPLTGPARDVTHANDSDGMTFVPFCGGYEGDACAAGRAAEVGAALLLGFTSALPFSREEIGLHLLLAEEGLALLAEPAEADCSGPVEEQPDLAWEWWDGTDWSALDVTGDETRQMTASGQVFVKVGGQIPAVATHAVDVAPVHAPAALEEVAGVTEHLPALRAAGIGTPARLAGLSVQGLCDLLLPPGLPAEEVEAAKIRFEALLADAKRLAERQEPLYYWLRVRFRRGSYRRPPRLDRVVVNSVLATAARTVANEVVGASDGRPNQVMRLGNAPVLADPPLQLDVPEAGRLERWEEVTDFAASLPDSRHYTLNRGTGEITFGDGRRGRIPPVEPGQVIARSYRHGGGRIGNVGANTITDVLTPLRAVEQVTNLRPAAGGEDEEPLEETKLRVPRQILKARDRAVTLEDFEVLARLTPSAPVGRADARIVTDEAPPADDGAAPCSRRTVRVIVIPAAPDPKPVPSESTLRLVCRYLDARRLLTTRLRVAGPAYRDFDVLLDARAGPAEELRSVKNALVERLTAYFSPLTGGADGRGLPFGGTVAYSTIVREIMAVPGVTRIESLRLRKLLRAHPSSDEADAAKAGDLAAELAAFAPPCSPDAVVVSVVTPAEAEGAVQITAYTAAVYDCCDLPLAADELPTLRVAEVSISYDRGRTIR
jgi:hypothetical protein